MDGRFLTEASRTEHIDAIVEIIERALEKYTTEEWVAVLRDVGVAVAPC